MKHLLIFTLILLASYSVKSQSTNRPDTIFKINPYVEMKKGVILQSVALAGFGLTTIFHLTKPPIESKDYINLGMAYGASSVMFFVGTVYHV